MNQKAIFSAVVFLSISALTMASVNVALNKPAIASHFTDASNWGDGEAFLSVDGDYESMWNAGDWGHETDPEWLIVDLGTVYSIQQINLWSENYTEDPVIDGGTTWYVEYNLYYSIDQSWWGILYHDTLVDTLDALDEIVLFPTQMRYIKYEVIGGNHWAHLNEMEVFEVPEPTTLLLLGLGGLLIKKR